MSHDRRQAEEFDRALDEVVYLFSDLYRKKMTNTPSAAIPASDSLLRSIRKNSPPGGRRKNRTITTTARRAVSPRDNSISVHDLLGRAIKDS